MLGRLHETTSVVGQHSTAPVHWTRLVYKRVSSGLLPSVVQSEVPWTGFDGTWLELASKQALLVAVGRDDDLPLETSPYWFDDDVYNQSQRENGDLVLDMV
ncbi:hypothetical protein HYALB_00012343 [Hymenoscyphus albidus]|uniref:Uncharacterized protein n=1 Tax=Hymenoscyphus albidus TaxID=595503 RepID=A0A9N9Q8Z5_9HELO|nr:hypothetical protein HYALB_00012343 [Hymenoscyphus albidus]